MESNIRNFCIIAHIDHGKSTLADRFLELTKTVESRKMHAQLLDSMELEQERGITIKLQPVTMVYRPSQTLNKLKIQNSNNQTKNFEFRNSDFGFINSEFILNLIDTPGHIDFTYEVSRSLAAVEGAILLVDATQGVEAQTMTNVELARAQGLTIIPVLNKIDLPHARIDEVSEELAQLLKIDKKDILKISAKTGEGVSDLLDAVVSRVPPPKISEADALRALIFDFDYSPHKGVIAYIRVFGGEIKKGEELKLHFADEKITAAEVGVFSPARKPTDKLSANSIGYIVTNIKKPEIVKVGDTIFSAKNPLSPLPGYKEPQPVVFSSLYPESQDDFEELKSAFHKLHLTDSAFSYEVESDAVLGRGFRCGFLGMLHLEIVIERIKREFGIGLIVATPTVAYEVIKKGGAAEMVYSPSEFPDAHEIVKVMEPWIDFEVLSPESMLGPVLKLLQEHSSEVSSTDIFGMSRLAVKGSMPAREMMRGFFDKLKSVSQGYASFNYETGKMREADVARIDVLVAEERVPAFSRVVARHQVEYESRRMVEKLHDILPRQLFTVKIQAQSGGRIIASRALSALKKDVTGYLYGGDRTRKMKLWQKQKKGKKKLQSMGKVNIPQEVFVKMIKE